MTSPKGVFDIFKDLADPRVSSKTTHKLHDIVGIAIVSMICGAESWDDMNLLAESKRSWLSKHLCLANGIPSADTIRRVFERLLPGQFESCFQDWVRTIFQTSVGDVVAVDGKCVRGSDPLCVVSAWCTANDGLCLGQQAVQEKSNEIEAIPRLLEMLDIAGATVTIDAIGCQREIARKIVVDCRVEYILAVKKNQSNLHADLSDFFENLRHELDIPCDTFSEFEQSHGRKEQRVHRVFTDVSWLKDSSKWCGLSAIGVVENLNEEDEKRNTKRYYILSEKLTAEVFAQKVRSHWAVENNLHWTLDVTFSEDSTKIKDRNSNRLMNMMRKVSLHFIKSIQPKGLSLKQTRKKCAWNSDFLESSLVN